MTDPIYTVGHSTRTLDEFLALLREHGIRTLVDVRRFPGSRRHPHFGGGALAASLAAEGIGYAHEPDLGGRRAVPGDAPPSPNGAWRNPAFRAYADHMGTAEFRAALERVMERGRAAPTTIMCAEAVPWRCHRRLIADALLARGVPVTDLLGPGRSGPHAPTPGAVLRPDGGVEYPAPPPPQGELFGG